MAQGQKHDSDDNGSRQRFIKKGGHLMVYIWFNDDILYCYFLILIINYALNALIYLTL